MGLQHGRNPALVTPGLGRTDHAGELISSSDSQRPSVPQARGLSSDEERHLAECSRRGDAAARQLLVLAFKPLVGGIAWVHARKHDLDIDDLMQAGNIGLLRAIERFDPAKARFSTFARFWVFAEIQNVVKLKPVVKNDGVALSLNNIVADRGHQC